MNRHLSEDQIARCIVGQSTIAEVQHARECSECGEELNRFSKSVAMFQSSVHERIKDRIALAPSIAVSRSSGVGTRTQRWVLVAAAAVVLVVLPFIRTGNKPEAFSEPASTEADPDAVMNRVNLHLARTVPEPMEPLMMGLSDMNP
jgi:hypothetical protein